jgi:hypothetical protein
MAFGRFEVHAGDFKPGKFHQLRKGPFDGRAGILIMDVGHGVLSRETISLSQVAKVEKASQESVTRLGGAVGWGIAGDVLLGPVGLLAGVVAGSRGTNVDFVCQLKDGRKFVATAPSKVFTQLRSAAGINEWNSTARSDPDKATNTSAGQASAKRFGIAALIAWAYAAVSGLAGVAGIFTGDFLTGLLFLISAIVAMPLSAALLRQRFSIVVPGWLRAVGTIALLIAAGATVHPTNASAPTENPSGENSRSGNNEQSAGTAIPRGPNRAAFAVIIADTEYGLVVGGRTNLPRGSQMIVSVERGNALQGQDDTTVGDGGAFYAGPFSDRQNKLRPGKYRVEINSGMADVQPDDVKNAAGANWSNFTGPLVQRPIGGIRGVSVVSVTVPFRYTYNEGRDALSRSIHPADASISSPNLGWVKTGIANRVTARARAYNAEKENAFYACQTFIKRNLRDPDSADFMTTYAPGLVTTPSENLSEYRVLQKVRAANGFGGKTISIFRCDVHLSGDNWISDVIKEASLD